MGIQSSNEKGLGFVLRIVIGVKIDTLSLVVQHHTTSYVISMEAAGEGKVI